jgi:hypothetical protein
MNRHRTVTALLAGRSATGADVTIVTNYGGTPSGPVVYTTSQLLRTSRSALGCDVPQYSEQDDACTSGRPGRSTRWGI